MKKAKQNKTKTNSDVGYEYSMIFKVSIPPDQDTVDSRTELIANNIIKALEVAVSDVPDIKLEMSTFYGSAPINIPILKVNKDG